MILSEMLRRDPQYSPDILLYTYGAPRASDSTFINSVQPLVHHRIVNLDELLRQTQADAYRKRSGTNS
nr:hypothetical protein [Pseudomonas fluorescens]